MEGGGHVMEGGGHVMEGGGHVMEGGSFDGRRWSFVHVVSIMLSHDEQVDRKQVAM